MSSFYSKFKEHKEPFLYFVGLVGFVGLVFVVLHFTGSAVEEEALWETVEGKEYVSFPDYELEEGKDYKALIKTNFGEVKVDLFEANAPKTVLNFVFLVNDGFYNQTICHRVEKGFVVQCGDRNNKDGTGGPGYSFEDEINAVSLGLNKIKVLDPGFDLIPPAGCTLPDSEEDKDLTVKAYYERCGYEYQTEVKSKKFVKKVLGMANSGPNTNGSQFFFLTADEAKSLDGKHTVFGEVIEGWEVVERIENIGVDEMSMPVEAVVIEEIEMIEE